MTFFLRMSVCVYLHVLLCECPCGRIVRLFVCICSECVHARLYVSEVCLCMFVCACACEYALVFVCVCVRVCLCVHFVRICMCICVCLRVCIFVHGDTPQLASMSQGK